MKGNKVSLARGNATRPVVINQSGTTQIAHCEIHFKRGSMILSLSPTGKPT